MTQPSGSLGERIAFHRKRRGLSQVELSRLVNRSESWVSQVERGARHVDRLSVLAQVADVLNVPVTELAPDVPTEPSPVEHSPYVYVLRLALAGHPALAAVLDPVETADPAGLDALRVRADAVWPLVHASRYTDVGQSLADLIPELEAATRTAPVADRPALLRRLASVYQAAAAVLVRFGDVDATWLAADRALSAAERAGDPLLVAAGEYRLAQSLLSTGRGALARHAAARAADVLAAHLPSAPPELISVWGALNLVLAVAAARDGERRAVWAYIAKAQDAAARLGEDRNDFDTEFGPTNVKLHEVAVAVELGDAGDALDRAADVDPAALSPERRARFLLDLARAYGQRRRSADAVQALLDAEALTPEQVHDHPLVRELVRDLLQGEARRPNPQLRDLATRVGVPT